MSPELERELALTEVIAIARLVVMFDGTERISLEALREALTKYDETMARLIREGT